MRRPHSFARPRYATVSTMRRKELQRSGAGFKRLCRQSTACFRGVSAVHARIPAVCRLRGLHLRLRWPNHTGQNHLLDFAGSGRGGRPSPKHGFRESWTTTPGKCRSLRFSLMKPFCCWTTRKTYREMPISGRRFCAKPVMTFPVAARKIALPKTTLRASGAQLSRPRQMCPTSTS